MEHGDGESIVGDIERWTVEKEHIRERGWTGENVLSFCYAVPGGANEIAAVLNQHARGVEALRVIANDTTHDGRWAAGRAESALVAMGI